MLSRVALTLRSQAGKRLLRQAQPQRRNMGGGGSFMETNKFGERVGEVFGTVAWLWIFHRFRMDGAVLLGFAHPWDHGHDDHGSHGGTALSQEEMKSAWDTFAEKSAIPGEDDDDDDDDDEDDDDEDDDDDDDDDE